LSHLFGPSVPAPQYPVTPVFYTGTLGDSSVPQSFFTELICNSCLPIHHRGVQIYGCQATVLLFNCDHHIKAEVLGAQLQRRVKIIAENHYRSLPKEEKKTKRLTSADQWQIVKKSLERVLIMEAYSPNTLEVGLIALKNILNGNHNISLVLISGINTFFHQVTICTGIYHNAYLRRLLSILQDSIQNMNENLKVLYYQLNFFNKEDNFYKFRNPEDKLYRIKERVNLSKPNPAGVYTLTYNTTHLELNTLV
jgi:hypothetical protein